MSTNFQINQVYSFNVFPVQVLGNNFKNVTIQGVMDAESAGQFIDIQGVHREIYPFLPAGTPSDPFQYTYLKIKNSSGAVQYLAVPWIDDSSVVLVTARTCVATIANVSATDLDNIKAALLRNGFPNVTLALQ
jgi:hypothetical protein